MSSLGGESRAVRFETLCGRPMELPRFLRLAAAAASALADLHHRDVVHQDIQPHSLELDLGSGQVRIANSAPTPSLESRATLAYLSPEQTGRMNRPVDHRTDLYSLGVVFYQLLSGRLPFEASDPLEWVHCHVARLARPPAEVIPDLPQTVSDIVMKLLAKGADERYQSASGLKFDLQQCLEQWESNGQIEPFVLGARDISHRLNVPQRLYGREAEVAVLLDAFDRMSASGRPELVLVSGYSGIGKSSLVHELHRPIVRERGYFISGKFDQYKRDIPYATIAQAFRDLTQQILTGGEAEIARWKRELRETLGNNGQVIVDVIPQVELILGPQPAVPELPPTEAQNRFRLVFRQFIGAFTRQEHPLALFLDDLQWADSASLGLLKELLTHPEMRLLLLVGAFRDNEVTPAHPLLLTLDEAGQKGASISTIVLGPLSAEHLSAFIGDALHCRRDRAAPLAKLVHEKTAGNPFFAIQFLTALYEERLIAFDGQTGAWCWEMAKVRAKGFTDNVVDLMLGKLKRLPVRTQEVLGEVACLGNRADIGTLAVALGRTPEATHPDLWEAVRAGLLLRAGGTYTFLHDRVQEAAYSLIPEAGRAVLHLRIGRRLLAARGGAPGPLASTADQAIDEHLFETVSQLNRASALLVDTREREQVAQLNLRAARRARASAAFSPAADYCAAGLRLLGPDAWTAQYELAFALSLNRAECELAGGSLKEAEQHLRPLSANARARVERAACRRVEIALHTARGQSLEALHAAIECLRMYDLGLAPHPTLEQVEAAERSLWERLGDRPIESVLDLPLMADGDVEAAVGVLADMLPSSYFVDLHLHRLVACLIVELTLRHGLCAMSPMGLAAYGFELSIKGRYAEADRFGRAALGMIDRHGFVACRAKVCNILGAGIVVWTRDLHTAVEFSREGIRAGLEGGDLIFACLCHVQVTILRLAAGDRLDEVLEEAQRSIEFIRSSGYGPVADGLLLVERLVHALQGRTEGGTSFGSPDFDEAAFVQGLTSHPLPLMATWFHIFKLQACSIFGDTAAALASAAAARPLLQHLRGQHAEVDVAFFYALALSSAAEATLDTRQAGREDLQECQERLASWRASCPPNYDAAYALVSAEMARLEGRDLDAMRLYERAIRSARENGFVQNEALAYERASSFYRARGFGAFADTYLREARSCYLRWGADGKAKQLDSRCPRLEDPSSVRPTRTLGPAAPRFDVLAIAKASQAISGEILQDRLLDTLARTVLENAGADRGCLLLMRDAELSLAAEASVDGQVVNVRLQRQPGVPETLPESILNYVRRSRDKVILGDVSEPNPFSADAYLSRAHPRSALCLPILRQAELVGLLYLENNLVTHAFTPERLAVLEVLASQAAISLDNARLYEDLAEENADRMRAEVERREAEDKYRSIVENAVGGVFQTTPDGRFVTANPAMARMLGFDSPEELIAATSDIATQLYVEPAHRREFKRMLDAQGQLQGFVTRTRRKDGDTIWVSASARAVVDAAGRVLYYEGTAEDVTERKRAEEAEAALRAALKKAAVEWEQTFNSMEMPILILDRAGRVVRFNSAARQLARQRPSEELPGRLVADLGPGQPWQSASEAVVQVVRTRAVTHCQVRDDADGKTWEVAAGPSPGPTDEEDRVIVVARDVTQTVQLQESLRRSETMSAMGMLVAGVAHEVRNPLFTISATLDAFEARIGARSEFEPFTGRMRDEVKRLAAVMQDLLDFGKPAQSARSPGPIDTVVAIAVARSADLAARGQVALANRVVAGLPTVCMDRKRLIRVFENLLQNAIEHSPRGAVVTVEASQEDRGPGAWLVLTVEDSGPGFAWGDLPRVFEPFFSRRRGGTGLGLAIVKRIVEEHQGSISAANRPGGGAQMVVRLPCDDSAQGVDAPQKHLP